MTLFAAFVAYIGLLYLLSRGLKRLFRRAGLTPSVEAVTRVLLGLAAAVGLIFIIRGLEALSLP